MNRKKFLRSTSLLTALAVTAGFLAQSAPSAAEDAIVLYRRIAIARTADELSLRANTDGTPIVDRDPTMHSTANLLHATGQLESASKLSLNELGDGLDLSYGYLAAPRDGIPADYYIGRLKIDDPTRPETAATWSLLDESGRNVAEAAGDFTVEGEQPPPDETFLVTCESSYGAGIDGEGNSCVNVVMVCEGWTGTFVYQGCMKTVE